MAQNFYKIIALITLIAMLLSACGGAPANTAANAVAQPAPRAVTSTGNTVKMSKKSPEAVHEPKAVPVPTPPGLKELQEDQVIKLIWFMSQAKQGSIQLGDGEYSISQLVAFVGGVIFLKAPEKKDLDCSTAWYIWTVESSDWAEGVGDWPKSIGGPMDLLNHQVEIKIGVVTLQWLLDYLENNCNVTVVRDTVHQKVTLEAPNIARSIGTVNVAPGEAAGAFLIGAGGAVIVILIIVQPEIGIPVALVAAGANAQNGVRLIQMTP